MYDSFIESIFFHKRKPMPVSLMKRYYKGIDLYVRILYEIVLKIYKPKKSEIVNEFVHDGLSVNLVVNNGEGKIYMISSEKTDLIYIGSTYDELYNRLRRHVLDYECFKKYKDRYVSSYKIIDSGGYKIKLLEKLGKVNRKTLLIRESYYIEKYKLKCVNIVDPATQRRINNNIYEYRDRKKERQEFIIKTTIEYIIDNDIKSEDIDEIYDIYVKCKKNIQKQILEHNKGYLEEIKEIERLSAINIFE